MESKKKHTRGNDQKLLMILIAVLAVVLAVVVCVAVGISNNAPTTVPGTTAGEGTSVPSTQGTTAPPVSAQLTFTELVTDGSVTLSDVARYQGTSDPNEALTVNGVAVTRNADGSFTYEHPLSLGKNEIVFAYMDQTVTFTVERRYVIYSFSPEAEQKYGSGATVRFEVIARSGSQITADFNGQSYTLTRNDAQTGAALPEGFARFVGECKLTSTNTSDLDLGAVTFTALCDGVTETCASGSIICQKAADLMGSDPSVTPDYGDYVDVGSGYIVEIITYSAETFDGDTLDDFSHPTNSYLPKGTVDYASANVINSNKMQYMLLRCGRRVYVQKKNTPSSKKTQVVDCYKGTLPDHNEMGFASMQTVGNHTVLTLDTMWKAPFYFDILPQAYEYPGGGSNRSYQIAAFTATYIDITLCYTTSFSGDVAIPDGNPIFKSAEIIQNKSDAILRLHLRKTGGFYGWDSFYNEKGQLCFAFLNPAKATKAENALGADLTGITVMLDIGHGGVDGGAVGKDANGNQVTESSRNVALANALKAQLESAGATVVLNRETEYSMTVDERIQILKNAAPDICIAIHHNSIQGHPEIDGFECFYYSPFSMLAAKQVYEQTKQAEVYKDNTLYWHNYYVARQTCCPVVLTENGYMTSQFDLNNAIDEASIAKKAQAIAKGVADYFLLINQ